MHIVHVTNYLVPELGYQELFLAREQARVGHEVTVVTSNLKLPRNEYAVQKESLGDRRYPTGEFWVEAVRLVRLPARLEAATRLWMLGVEEAIRNLRPAVVIAHGLSTINSIRVARLHRTRRLAFHLIFDEHMVYGNRRRGWAGNGFYAFYRRFITPLVLSEAADLIAVTPDTMRFMEVEYGIPRDRIRLVPLGADTNRFFCSESARKELRAKWGIDDSHVLGVYAGKVTRTKGIGTLVDAALALWPTCPELRLLIVGNADQDFAQGVKARLEAAGKPQNVIWADAIANDQLYRYYSAADFGVWPGNESITQLEGAACGLPLIIPNVPSLSNRIANNNGLACAPGNVDDLAGKMALLIKDPSLRREMGKRSRELIVTRLSWPILAREFLASLPQDGRPGNA